MIRDRMSRTRPLGRQKNFYKILVTRQFRSSALGSCSVEEILKFRYSERSDFEIGWVKPKAH